MAECVQCHRPALLGKVVQLAEDHMLAYPSTGDLLPSSSSAFSHQRLVQGEALGNAHLLKVRCVRADVHEYPMVPIVIEFRGQKHRAEANPGDKLARVPVIRQRNIHRWVLHKGEAV